MIKLTKNSKCPWLEQTVLTASTATFIHTFGLFIDYKLEVYQFVDH